MTMNQIGTVIEGTLRPEDLIPTFVEELRQFNSARAHGLENEYVDYDNDDDAKVEILTELIDALNEYAPPYTYFGLREGDGSDYGWWPDVEGLMRDARYDDDITSAADLADDPAAAHDDKLVVHTNDHGNITLYRRKVTVEYEEIWAVV